MFASLPESRHTLTCDALFVGVLPRGALLWMRHHLPHHFEMLLSLESINEGLERSIFVLVHLEEPVPSLLEVVASHSKVPWMPLDFGVDALDCGAHNTPEARGSGAALAFASRAQGYLPKAGRRTCPKFVLRSQGQSFRFRP